MFSWRLSSLFWLTRNYEPLKAIITECVVYAVNFDVAS